MATDKSSWTRATVTSTGGTSTGAVINCIQQNMSVSDSNIHYAPFGVDDENVQIYYNVSTDPDNARYEEWGSLRDFFQEWLNFKKTWEDFLTNGHFIVEKESNDITANNTNVKLWFQTPPILSISNDEEMEENLDDTDIEENSNNTETEVISGDNS